jgi:hypothetical protein
MESGIHREFYQIVLVNTDVPVGTRYFHTGIARLDTLLKGQFSRPSYVVGVVETLSAAEVKRHDEEEEISKHDVKTINGALKGLHDPPALLLPEIEYVVNVDWEWAVCEADGTVTNENDPGTWTTASQEFRFRTDDVPLKPRTVKASPGEASPGVDFPEASMKMPVKLDSWTLITNPDEGDKFYFWGQHLTVVLAVDYLLYMYADYNVPLQAKVRAASYRNSDPVSINYLKTLVDVTPSMQQPVKGGQVFTPWEGTVRDVLKDLEKKGIVKCIDTSGEISRHTKLDLNLLLEPMTEYIFDIELKNTPAPPPNSTVTPLFRRNFKTSRYRDAVEMCAAVAAASVRQAPTTDGEIVGLIALAGAPGKLSASALDDALRAAGLEPATPVTTPIADLLWLPDVGGLQPRVLVLRTPEPLTRTRRTPTDYEPPGQPRLDRKITRLEDSTYLKVVTTSGNPNPASFQMITAPGMGTIVFLITSGRGKTLDLSLRVEKDPFLDDSSGNSNIELLKLNFASAPWEEA